MCVLASVCLSECENIEHKALDDRCETEADALWILEAGESHPPTLKLTQRRELTRYHMETFKNQVIYKESHRKYV